MENKNKPSVLLLGDSISLGYREFVKENLRGAMEVFYPPENGRMIAYTFRELYTWQQKFKWSADMDFVYWNNGLWDVVRIFGDEPQTPLPEYENLIQRTYNRLRHLFPQAQIIFATTTPVVEEFFDKKIFTGATKTLSATTRRRLASSSNAAAVSTTLTAKKISILGRLTRMPRTSSRKCIKSSPTIFRNCCCVF